MKAFVLKILGITARHEREIHKMEVDALAIKWQIKEQAWLARRASLAHEKYGFNSPEFKACQQDYMRVSGLAGLVNLFGSPCYGVEMNYELIYPMP